MQAMGKAAQLGEPGAQFGEHALELPARVIGHFAVGRQPPLQFQCDRHEPLLRAVVEIALDLAAGSVGGVQDASTRGVDLGELRLDDLSLPQSLFGCAADGDVEDCSIQPAPTVTGILGLTAFEHPAHVTVAPLDPVFQAERTAGVHGLLDRPFEPVRDHRDGSRVRTSALELRMKSAAGYPEISSISWLTHAIVQSE